MDSIFSSGSNKKKKVGAGAASQKGSQKGGGKSGKETPKQKQQRIQHKKLFKKQQKIEKQHKLAHAAGFTSHKTPPKQITAPARQTGADDDDEDENENEDGDGDGDGDVMVDESEAEEDEMTPSQINAQQHKQQQQQQQKQKQQKHLKQAAQPQQPIQAPTTISSDAPLSQRAKKRAAREAAAQQIAKKQKTGDAAVDEDVTGTGPSNAYLDVYHRTMAAMPHDMDRLLDPQLSDDRREKLFDILDLAYAEKFAWAVPDARAISICCHYSPLVEIGCGLGYWGSLIQHAGATWVGYDQVAVDKGKSPKAVSKGKPAGKYPAWTAVLAGSPLSVKNHPHSNLLLSYPDDYEDDDNSMALECLKHHKGEYVILIGEVFGHTSQDNPWGKSCHALFQQELASSFHKILQVPLPSWPGSYDVLSVWKRTIYTEIDDMRMRFVPASEQLQLTQACTATRHLLQVNTST